MLMKNFGHPVPKIHSPNATEISCDSSGVRHALAHSGRRAVASTMTLRRDAFPASPVNARLCRLFNFASLPQCSPCLIVRNRQGFRTDLMELVDELSTSEIKKGTKTRSLIAKRVGFTSDYIYRQLKRILQHGCLELIYQVRHNKISVSKAAALADLSHDKQIIQLSKIS